MVARQQSRKKTDLALVVRRSRASEMERRSQHYVSLAANNPPSDELGIFLAMATRGMDKVQ
jgi:hypothetical protein